MPWRRAGLVVLPTAEQVRHPLDRPAALQPMVVLLAIWAGTPGRGLPSGTTSASLSHRPSHASLSQIDMLENWTLTPSRSSSALFNVRPPTPSRRPREQNEEQTDDYFGDRPRVSGRPLPPLASLRARAP